MIKEIIILGTYLLSRIYFITEKPLIDESVKTGYKNIEEILFFLSKEAPTYSPVSYIQFNLTHQILNNIWLERLFPILVGMVGLYYLGKIGKK